MVLPSRNPSSSFPNYSDVPETNVRRRDSRFISQADLDNWIRDRRAMVAGSILTVVASGDRYVLRDAVRILAPRGVDLFGMTGRVVPIAELLTTGATVSSWSVRIGTADYDAQIGYVAQLLDAVSNIAAQA